ncbi:MAG: chemotaxis protein CheD [Rhodobacteraceae bacterium]|nr:chemotaxis protein CheD [Paracoccaceae bacterium]
MARTVLVVQGEYHISDRPEDMLTTLLGSCVAACLYDSEAGVGGMNHFLLPGEAGEKNRGLRYGAYAMELLINSLLKRGADRRQLQAKLFGGAKMNATSGRIGSNNADFALWFLRNEGIPVTGQNVGGTRGRKVRFWPHSGRAQQMFMSDTAPLLAQEAAVLHPEPRQPKADTDTVFF